MVTTFINELKMRAFIILSRNSYSLNKFLFCLVAIITGLTNIHSQNDNYTLWEFSKDIAINTTSSGANISSNVSSYPVLIRLSGSNFNFTEAQSNGGDIRFASYNGNHLVYEIERWDATNQLAEIWVKYNVLGNNNSQYVRMYWGNSSAVDSSKSAQVFNTSSGYVGVWHFKENGNNTANGYKDATSNGNNGTGFNMTSSSDVSAYIGIGQEFNGTSNYIQINNNLLKDILTSSKVATISFWVKTNKTNYARAILWEGDVSGDGFGSDEEIHLGYGEPNGTLANNYLHFYSGDEDDNNNGGDHCNVEYGTTDVTNWHHVAVTYNVSGTNEVAELFWDGTSVDIETGGISGNYGPSWNANTLIGKMGSSTTRYFEGIIDELRITQTILDDNSIALDEAIQNSSTPTLNFENLAPTLNNIESSSLNYTENDGQVIITSTIDVEDGDDISFQSASVSIGNYRNGEDLLSFTTIGNITGNWNSATGNLTLSGTDTKTNYLSALRSIKYSNTSEDPTTTTRTISFQVNDADDASNIVTRSINVSKQNDTPVDINLSNTNVNENQSVGTTVGAFSTSDPDASDTHTYSLVSGTGSAGNSAFQLVGTQLQTNVLLNEETQNSYSIRVRTTDNGVGNLYFDKVFTISILDINDAPGITSAAIISATEDLVYTYNITATDEDADVPTFTSSALPAWLSLTDNGNGTATLSGTPGNGDVNSFSITIHASDGTVTTNQPFTLTVNGINDVPIFTKGANQSVNEDAGAQTVSGWATGIGDGDPELTQTLSFTVSNDNNALFSVQPSIDASGTLTYTTASNSNGSATVTVTLSDNGSGVAPNANTSSAQTFTITVTSINDVPVFNSTAIITANEDVLYTYNITATDIDAGDLLTITAPTLPAWLTITDNGNGTATLSGTPTNSNVGSNAVILNVSDGTNSVAQTFTIIVTNANDAPIFTSTAPATATEDIVYTYNITTTDTDAGDILTITAPTLPAWLTITDNSNGTATLFGTPEYQDIGSYNINILVNDGTMNTSQNFQIEVIKGFTLPLAVADNLFINEDEQIQFNVLSNDQNPGNEAIIASLTQNALYGTASINSNGILLYNPNQNFHGNDLIYYSVCIEGSAFYCDTAAIRISVEPQNDKPIILDQTIQPDNSGKICISVEDVDSNICTLTEILNNSNTYRNISQDLNSLCFEYTTVQQYQHEEIIQCVICDNGSPVLCDTANIRLVYNMETLIDIKEGISPNGDGINDLWIIRGIERFPINTIKIYNRWGDLIYEAQNYDNNAVVWAGEINRGLNLGQEASGGTYYYLIELNESNKPVTGYIIVK